MSEASAHDGLAQEASRAAPNGDRKRILFVDDEPRLLEGLRDAMREYRRVWRVDFAPGEEAALAALEEQPADVVIADMQMPGDGRRHAAQVRP